MRDGVASDEYAIFVSAAATVAIPTTSASTRWLTQRQAKSIPGQVEVFTKEEDAFAHLDAL